MLTPQKSEESPRFSMSAVCQRTGLSDHVIRVWERRYGAVSPYRDDNGHRLYSERDINRLLMLSGLVDLGQSIGRIARLSDEELKSQRDAIETTEPDRAAASRGAENSHLRDTLLESVLESARRYDIEACCNALSAAVIGMNVDDLMNDVCSPIMRAVGDEWCSGRLNEAQEHILAIAFESYFLPRITATLSRQNAPAMVFATLQGERHHMGLLFFAMMAAARNIRCFFLGSDLPENAIADAATNVGADVLCLSVVQKVSAKQLAATLQGLRDMLPEDCDIWIGGCGTEAMTTESLPAGCHVIDNRSFADKLEQAARSGARKVYA